MPASRGRCRPIQTRRGVSGAAIGLAPERNYADYQALLAAERSLPESERAEFVAIVTPNHIHAPAAIAAMEAGFPVLTDKPLADTLEAAQTIRDAARRTGALVGITHAYLGYPMVRQARDPIAAGELGAVRYPRGWLANAEDAVGKQAEWRIDPARSGLAGAFGDIGTHAFNLVEFMTGEAMMRIAAELRAAVPGRALDDDGMVLFHLSGGGRGTLIASQICVGDANSLEISIWGERAALHWGQEHPNHLRLARRDQPERIWTPGVDCGYLSGGAMAQILAAAGWLRGGNGGDAIPVPPVTGEPATAGSSRRRHRSAGVAERRAASQATSSGLRRQSGLGSRLRRQLAWPEAGPDRSRALLYRHLPGLRAVVAASVCSDK